MTRFPHLRPVEPSTEESPAQASRRLAEEARSLALAEAQALAGLDAASIGGRQIAEDYARDAEKHIQRLMVLHAKARS